MGLLAHVDQFRVADDLPLGRRRMVRRQLGSDPGQLLGSVRAYEGPLQRIRDYRVVKYPCAMEQVRRKMFLEVTCGDL